MQKHIALLLYIIMILYSCSNHSSTQKINKKFKEPGNVAVFTTKFVIAGDRAITTVKHDKDDGSWQFLSDDKFEDYASVAKLVALSQIIKIDSTVCEVADLPLGFMAHRKNKHAKWEIQQSGTN